MPRSQQANAKRRLDHLVRPGKHSLGVEKTTDQVLCRGTFFLALDLGELSEVRFSVEARAAGALVAPVTLGEHEGSKWFQLLLDGRFSIPLPGSGMYAIPYVAVGCIEVRGHLEITGEAGSTGKLAIWHNFQQSAGV